MNYDIQNGVMKGSYRKRAGGGFYIDYRINNLQIKNYVTFNSVKSRILRMGLFLIILPGNPMTHLKMKKVITWNI